MKNTFITLLSLFFAFSINAATDKYRLMFNGNPSTEITIAWNQISGSGQEVYWGTTDFGTTWASYPNNNAPYRSTSYLAMENQFVNLTGLTPNTVYYFVIKDSEGTSDRFWFKTCPNVNTEKLSFISGGDSRSGTTQRQNANKMVAKIRPHAVLFGGDLVNTPSDASYAQWFDDWQLTTTADGQMIPVVHSFGNHEDYGVGGPNLIRDLFDTPYDVYYNVTFGGNLFSMYTLNGELLPGHTIANGTKRTAQTAWLSSSLTSDNAIWKAAQYHRPIVPHHSSKGEGADDYEDWANLFYDNGVRLVMESDAHVVKMTDEVKPVYTGAPSGSSSNWFTSTGLDPNKGITFIGEGSWGTIRTPDDNHPMTTASASFYGFNWITVDQCRIEIRTIDTQNPNGCAAHAYGDYFSIDAGLEAQVWKPTALPTGVREIIRCNAPVADFSGDQTNIFTGTTVNFTDLSTNSPTSWSWTFGDGGTSTAQNPSYQYNTAGTYTVTLSATNADGTGVETKTDYIVVSDPVAPTAEFTADVTTQAIGLNINFTDLSTGVPASWAWDFGDGSGTSTAQNPTYAYAAAGTYTVTLTATNAYGNDSEIKTSYITIVNTTTVDIPIATGNDDVEEKNSDGSLYFTSSDLEFCYDGSTSNANQHVGLRFQNVPVPQGAVISNAYITFRADEGDNTETILWIAANDVDNAAAWSGNYDVSGRTKTTSQYGWVHDASTAWTVNSLYQTPDIRALVQEIISRPGWSPNNAMAFMFWDDNVEQDERVGDSFEGGFVAELHIEYSVGGTPPLDYCPSFYVGNDNEYISNVSFNTINNTSGDVMEGYTDFTSISTDVAQNSVHQLDVTINTGGNSTYHCEAFFDWNQDGDFNDANESFDLGDITNVTAGVLSTNVTVPAGATLGNTRMRIGIEKNGNPGACNTDHNNTSGATEDYTVNVIAALPTPPVAAFTSSVSTICSGQTISFTDNSTNSPTSWAWDFGDGSGTSTAQNPTYAYTNGGTFTVTLTATNADGSDSETTTITVNATPNVVATGGSTICEGASVSINATGATSYSWDNSIGAGASHTVTPSTTTTYIVTGTTSGCTNTDQITVTVNPVPTVSATGSTTICSGNSASINASGATTYSWDNSIGAGAAQTVSPTSTTIYTVTGTTSGCSNTDQVTISVNPTPTVVAIGSTTICEGESTNINVSGATSYSWDNGVGTGATHTISPTTNTTYIVTGTTNGCSNTDQITVNVDTQSDPGTANPVTACITDNNVNLLDAINGEDAGGAWSDDNSTGALTGSVLDATGLTVGNTYDFTYSFAANGACSAVQVTTQVTVTDVVDAGVPTAQNSACSDNSTFDLFNGLSGYTSGGNWNDDDATGGLTGNTFDASSVAAGTYDFTYAVTSAGCGSDNQTITITVNATPTVTVSNDESICEGTTTNIVASGATSYNWDNGLGAGTSHTVSPTTTTTYTATGDENGCTSSASVTITVNTLPVVSMDAFVSDTVCLDDATFALPNGNPTGGAYSGTGVNGTDFDPYVAGPGTHSVSYEYTDGNGCSNSATQQVVVIDCNLSLTENGINEYKIYPNPTNGIVKIEFVNTNQSRITIYDMNGKVVLDKTSTDNPIILDMSTWERGTYNVKIVNTDTQETKIDKIILK